MTAQIHPTAIVDPTVTLGANVKIGPYCIVQGPVVLHDDVELKSHVIVEGHTSIGKGTVVYSFAVLGSPTPDRKYKGEASKLVIGENNIIREYVTMHPGTAADRNETTIGNNNLILERVHIAHDCVIGSHCTIINSVGISGHVVVEDYVTIGGMTGITQFVRIGHHAFVAGYVKLEEDVIPYGLVRGDHGYLDGINIIGMQRRNISQEEIVTIRKAYRQLFARDGTLAERIAQVSQDYSKNELVMDIVRFIQNRDGNALCQPRAAAA